MCCAFLLQLLQFTNGTKSRNASHILMVKKRYNPLHYFRMEIKEEISFFFYDVEDPSRNQKLCTEMMRKLKIKVRGMLRKKGLNLHKTFTEKLKALC